MYFWMMSREVFKIIEDIVSRKQDKITRQLDILSDMLEDCNQAFAKVTGHDQFNMLSPFLY